ncbi:TetR/AcrR family transcriptional regulator [Nonomuraea muscovyensis]|uniref:DNA-binding transcriptional regulator YbjK n=1 Tax=Nonomuraea muscovyensis TaxID=1124761 RepID=A0A7X0F0K1_9ACTN|nr:TetR family transcriptional regulator C-terminal domain-containing protein [Nonomuraea muscovyensis]MBB6351377.1 DNA-binding transcriptional regulator YbjK [Nonomuraea muscovyensis]MDF2706526.1 TetR/AcrR family transcriptional regulator [Nonomuraea muscovyensis]
MKRSDTVAEAAITLLAERGMRGLTHRAVDEAAGLPPGSTSNLARTRAALLELTLARLTSLEERALAPAMTGGLPSREELPDVLAEAVRVQIADRRRTLARYELALEATRRPELRAIYDRAGRRFRDPAVALLAAAGSRDPARHARQVVAFGEGMMFDAVAGAGTTPSRADLREAMRELLSGMLDRDPDTGGRRATRP